MPVGSNKADVHLVPVQLPRIRAGESLATIILQTVERENLGLKSGDVLAVASKVVSTCEGRIAKLDDVRISNKTRRLGRRWGMDERLAGLVLDEAQAILGGVRGFLLTIKNGILTANAGVDLKNSPPGTATLWPKNPDASAAALRSALENSHGVRLGVEIVDSRLTPLRLGTTGLVIGLSGFMPVDDHRGKLDLYRRKVRVTRSNVADDLAASAHLLMGETKEKIGAVLIRNAPIVLSESANSRSATLRMERCLITSNIVSVRKRFRCS